MQSIAMDRFWPSRACCLSVFITEAISGLRKQIRILCREGLGQLLFEQTAEVPQSSGLSLVSYRQLVRLRKAIDELKKHERLIGTEFKVNALLLIHVVRVADNLET